MTRFCNAVMAAYLTFAFGVMMIAYLAAIVGAPAAIVFAAVKLGIRVMP